MPKIEMEPWMLDGPNALDDGILGVVKVLREAGIDTFHSCQGGPSHSSEKPEVRFHGDENEGFRAEEVTTAAGYQVFEICRFWYSNSQGERLGPYWEITFVPGAAHRGFTYEPAQAEPGMVCSTCEGQGYLLCGGCNTKDEIAIVKREDLGPIISDLEGLEAEGVISFDDSHRGIINRLKAALKEKV